MRPEDSVVFEQCTIHLKLEYSSAAAISEDEQTFETFNALFACFMIVLLSFPLTFSELALSCFVVY